MHVKIDGHIVIVLDANIYIYIYMSNIDQLIQIYIVLSIYYINTFVGI